MAAVILQVTLVHRLQKIIEDSWYFFASFFQLFLFSFFSQGLFSVTQHASVIDHAPLESRKRRKCLLSSVREIFCCLQAEPTKESPRATKWTNAQLSKKQMPSKGLEHFKLRINDKIVERVHCKMEVTHHCNTTLMLQHLSRKHQIDKRHETS